MLTTNQIFALGQLQSQDASNTSFTRVLAKINACGLPLGTPFIIPTDILQEVSKNYQKDYEPVVVIMNPCPIGKEYKPNTLAEVTYSQIKAVSEPAFLDVHFTKDAGNVKDFNDAFNHALGGGAATIFFKDAAVAKEILIQVLPELYRKYPYVGTFRSSYMPSTEKTVLMVQFFHPKHCCAVYYPDKVDGVIINISAVMLEASVLRRQVERPIFVNLFVSNFLDNILTLDGSQITNATPIDNSYLKIIECCYLSMVQDIKQTKKQAVVAASPLPPPPHNGRPSIRPPKPQDVYVNRGVSIDDWMPEEVPQVSSGRLSAKAANTLNTALNSRVIIDDCISEESHPVSAKSTLRMGTTVTTSATSATSTRYSNIWDGDLEQAVRGNLADNKHSKVQVERGSVRIERDYRKSAKPKKASALNTSYYIDTDKKGAYSTPYPEVDVDQPTLEESIHAAAVAESQLTYGEWLASQKTAKSNIGSETISIEQMKDMVKQINVESPSLKRMHAEIEQSLSDIKKASCLREGYGGGSSKQKTADTSGESEDNSW